MTKGTMPQGMFRILAPSVAMALAAVLAGCGDTAQAERLHLDDLPTLTLQEDGRIGSFDDPDIGFSRIGDVAVDHHGHVLVSEAQADEIRMYDEGGELIRTIGGPGEGPGEFEGTPRFGVVGDTIWAYDSGQRRITLFDHGGTVLSAERTDGLLILLPSCPGYVMPWAMRPDGRFMGYLSRIACTPDDPPSDVERGDSIPVPRVLFGASGEIVDTVGWDPSPPPRMYSSEPGPEFRSIQTGSGSFPVPTPPSDRARWYPLLDGRVVVDDPSARPADDVSFTVTRIGVGGDTAYHREIRYRPEPYTEADLDSVAARASRRSNMYIGGQPAPVPPDADAVASRLREAMDFPPYRKPIQHAEVTEDGGVWLRLWEGEGASTARWAVLDPDGQPRGMVELPDNARMVWSRGDVLWTSEPDEFGVPWLVRYRIQPPP